VGGNWATADIIEWSLDSVGHPLPLRSVAANSFAAPRSMRGPFRMRAGGKNNPLRAVMPRELWLGRRVPIQENSAKGTDSAWAAASAFVPLESLTKPGKVCRAAGRTGSIVWRGARTGRKAAQAVFAGFGTDADPPRARRAWAAQAAHSGAGCCRPRARNRLTPIRSDLIRARRPEGGAPADDFRSEI